MLGTVRFMGLPAQEISNITENLITGMRFLNLKSF